MLVEIFLSKIFYLHFGDVSLCALYKFDRGQQMKNYTEIFSQALKMKEGYDVKKLKKIIDSQNEFHCGDYDEWADNYWYMLTPQQMKSYDEYYGYLSLEYPIALLSENCPDKLKSLLSENGILHSLWEEPLSCDENILKQYVHDKIVFDEHFVDSCDYSFDDERFFWLMQKYETGFQNYIDAGCFMFSEIR